MSERQELRLTAVVTPDEDWFMARCLEVPVTSQGPTPEAAVANLREALELYLEDEPVPAPARVEYVDVCLSA